MSSLNLLYVFLIPFIVLLYLIKHRKKNNINVPPGPRKLPLIGNLHQLGDLPHRSLERLSNEHGPIMLLQLGSVPTLVISSADMAREVFKTHDFVFSGRPVLYAAKKLTYNSATVSFAPYGDYWREMRKIMITELLGAKRVQGLGFVRAEEVGNMIETIQNVSRSSSSRVINLSELYFLLANNVVCRVAERNMMVDMFLAGTDTSAGKEKVEESDLPKLTYLKLVIKEGFRLHPPAPLLVPRETTERCEIEGYQIAAKTRVFVNAKLIEKTQNIGRTQMSLNQRGSWKAQWITEDNTMSYYHLVVEGEAVQELTLLPNGMKTQDLDMEEAFGISMHKKLPLCLVATPFGISMND
ncbi:hypothetical protein FNV43_RR19528 [Rhamnella rubrinervis]|uniref:Cytochrome P450 n=1 Tax=Rhamnella rubrinervis TaxID=2594499 RepID=A0A8K0DT51_9ROSA|nr:hypothetical protein FNV43_RR19528 [Rhamnella rubrinervis]